ncbi:MAG: DUF4020 domain-containing protein [Chloroflexi bacterium]|nr:DUF4020 domain-containing protein [Chloroflexota bacterium]
MHLDALAEPLLSLAVRGLWRRYVVGRTWRNNNRYFDAHSWGRAAIEPHSQNKQPRVTDALLDMARDCLSHIAERNITVLQCWCDYLVASDAPLLRRLAIHTMAQRGDLSADSKVDWLLSQTDIHEIALHHEIYQALRIIYPSADSIHRQQIIDSILKYQMPRKGDIDSQRLTAYHRFSLFNWLHEAFPGCKLALERLNEVIREYPYFEARDHPDLTHWITSEQYLPLSPWTVESLLSRPAGEWREELLAFQDDSMSGPNREGVKDAIREALRQDYEWGFKLASALVANENWDSYIWSSIVEAWSDELTARQHRQVLQLLDQPALLAEHPSELSDLLLSLVKKNTAPYPLVVEANPLAAKLKNYIIQDKRILSEADWLQQAINHPAGALAEYWLHSLTIHRKQYPDRAALNEEYLSALSKIVEDETLVGHLGKAILGRNVHFLLDTDSEWTKKYFLPIFNDYTKKEACRAVWAGFMYGRPLTPAVADLMKEYFLEALPYFEELFPEEALRSGFISRYVAMLIYFVEDPFTEWVPRFFQYADSTQHRRHFVDSIGMVLRNTGEAPLSEFWNTFVKPFWQGRLRSIPPPPLEDEEIEAMLDWLPYLGAQFPEAVELVAQTPGAKLDDGLLVFGLKDRGLGEVYPEATAQLMIYLGASVQGLADWRWHLAKDLIDGLLELDLSEDSRTRLQELQVRLGLGDQPEG